MPADEEDAILVIGHQRPDLDSVAAAVGYAALLQAQGRRARPARAGHLDAQTQWALERFSVEAPPLVLDVAPTFGRVARPADAAAPETALAEVIERIAVGDRAVPVVGGDGRPLALIDARACVRMLGLAGARAGKPGSVEAIAESARRAAAPVFAGEAAAAEGAGAPGNLVFGESERISDRRAAVVRAEADDFLVVSGDGRYRGVASRGAILAPPRTRLALVDHNEIRQAVPGADEAEIVEVLDHHRLANPETTVPIRFSNDLVGAASTLVAERWQALGGGGDLPPALAGLLLAAIIADTLAFRSPTATERDRRAAERLAGRAGVADLDAFAEEAVAAGAGLGQRSDDEVVSEDSKEFETARGRIIVAQAEVRTLHEVAGRAEDLGEALERLRERRGAALAALLLTDPVRGRSRLLARGEARLVARLHYPHAADGTFDVGAIVSRKKQLLPALLAALE